MTTFRLRTVAVGAASKLTRGGFVLPITEADKRPYGTTA